MNLKERIQYWLGHKLPPCDVVTRQLSDAMERRLSRKQRLEIRLHLWTCLWCRRYEQQIEFLRRALRRYSDAANEAGSVTAMPDDVKARLKDEIDKHSH